MKICINKRFKIKRCCNKQKIKANLVPEKNKTMKLLVGDLLFGIGLAFLAFVSFFQHPQAIENSDLNLFHSLHLWCISILFCLFVFLAHFIKTGNKNYSSAKWFLWDFFGFRLIWSKIFTNTITDKSKPSSFFLWFIGIYIALFGIVSQRYENQIGVIESKNNIFLTLLSNSNPDIKKQALSLIPEIQKLPCAVKPEIFNPLSILQSLLKKERKNNFNLVPRSYTEQSLEDKLGRLK